jgi:ABC-type bacteriocin/lantibiotic exporter with double-glycine peptidase domain
MKSWFKYLKRGLKRKPRADKIAGSTKVKSNLNNLRLFLLKHWPSGIVGVLLILLSSPLGYIVPIINRFLIDDVILKKQLPLLFGVILLLVGIKVLEKLSGMLQQFYFTHFSQKVILEIQDDLLNKVFRLPKAFFDTKETGYLMSRVSHDVQGLQWFFSGTIVYILTYSLRFIIGVAFLVYLEWRLALVSVVLLPGIFFGVRYFSTKVRHLSREQMERQANVLKQMQESLAASSLIKAFTSEKHETDRIVTEIRESQQLNLERTTVQSLADLIIGSFADIANVIILLIGVPLIIYGHWTLGSLYAFFTYQSYVFNPTQFLANANLQLQSALASLERISAFYEILPETHSYGTELATHLTGAIEFKNVSFSYDGSEKILTDISFSIAKGEHLAIVGTSGVGKTTLISLILGFYLPTNGAILFDGKPSTDYELNSLRKRIGYVAQTTKLLAGTIMDNLRYGNSSATTAEVIQAAKVANIHDYIDSLPHKYDSYVGENGVNLSDGQKQRLSIARAFIKDPDILIFDEPTASLDQQTEKSIFAELPGLVRNKTLIIVAHRPSTIKEADKVLIIEDKKITVTGKVE